VLIGGWQSLLQHPDDVWLRWIFSQARQRGVSAPIRYASQIRQLRASSAFTPVMKDIAQVVIGDIY
jgi:hypothetical protein